TNVIDARIARNNATLTFSGDGSTIEVNVTVATKDFFTLGGARLNADGAVQSKVTFPRPAVTTDFRLQMRHPVVASNGDGFLVVYETGGGQSTGRDANTWLVAQAFDRAGSAIGNSVRSAGALTGPTDVSSK